MRVMAVNVAEPRPMVAAGKPAGTGIFKEPVSHRVWAGPLGLSGDHVMDTEHHGGADQAVYLYSAEDYDWWAQSLGAVPAPGTFGENLTVSSFGTATPRVGDRYRIGGGALLEVTAPRIPCNTFAVRMDDPRWVRTFRDARRPGLYARVLEPGEVGAGDAMTLIAGDAAHVSVVELFDLWFAKTPDAEVMRRALASPIAGRVRRRYEEAQTA